MQNARKCNEDSWDVRGLSAQVPIDFLDISSGHNFCPAKLFRDDPTFCQYMQNLFTCWEMGQNIDNGSFASMDEGTMDDLYDMISTWKRTERDTNYFRLGMMIGGDPDEKK